MKYSEHENEASKWFENEDAQNYKLKYPKLENEGTQDSKIKTRKTRK